MSEDLIDLVRAQSEAIRGLEERIGGILDSFTQEALKVMTHLAASKLNELEGKIRELEREKEALERESESFLQELYELKSRPRVLSEWVDVEGMGPDSAVVNRGVVLKSGGLVSEYALLPREEYSRLIDKVRWRPATDPPKSTGWFFTYGKSVYPYIPDHLRPGRGVDINWWDEEGGWMLEDDDKIEMWIPAPDMPTPKARP